MPHASVTTMTTPGSLNFTYTYNARNQLSALTNTYGQEFTFEYDNGGRRTRVNRPGSYIRYYYNERDWTTRVWNLATDGATLYKTYYYYNDGSEWDHVGNPLKRVEYFPGTGGYTATLRYDNVYRQTQELLKDPSNNTVYSESYGYDAVGNRTGMTRDGTSYTYAYDNNDKLTGITGGGQSASFTYDLNGNTTGVSGSLLGTWAMVYDDENGMTSVTYPSGGGSVTDLFYYSAAGQRMRARLAGGYRNYVYNGDRVLEEVNDSGTVTARYTTESGSYYAPWLHTRRSGAHSFPPHGRRASPLYDLTGTTRGLVDSTGAVTDTYTFDTFGRQVSSTGSTTNPYRFGGEWGYIRDPSNVLQLGARFYWPEVGRFVQQDPIGDGMNWYAYAGNNPVGWIDPEGLLTWQEAEDWYRNGMGGASEWVDQNLLFGQTARFGCTAGLYDAGKASGWDVAREGAKWGVLVGAEAYLAGKAVPKRVVFPKNVGGIEASWGRNLRAGWHRMPSKGNWRVPWARGRSLPHAHFRGFGRGIGRHWPWQ